MDGSHQASHPTSPPRTSHQDKRPEQRPERVQADRGGRDSARRKEEKCDWNVGVTFPNLPYSCITDSQALPGTHACAHVCRCMHVNR